MRCWACCLSRARAKKGKSLLSRPVLIAAVKDLESRRLLAHAQVYHALGQWLLGRGRAARRAPTPDFSTLNPRDAALLTVISTICTTSRQTTTVRQLAQLTEPLIALQLDGHARFLRHVLAPATVTQLTRTELEVLAGTAPRWHDLGRGGPPREVEPYGPKPSQIGLLEDRVLGPGGRRCVRSGHGLDRIGFCHDLPRSWEMNLR